MSAARRPGRLRRRSARPRRSGCRAGPRAAASAGVARSWARRSGEALRRIQRLAVAETARLGLRARLDPRVARPGELTHRDTGNSIAENHPRPRNRARSRSNAPFSGVAESERCRSELGREVTVDLEADADFDKGRSCPGHGRFLSTAGYNQCIFNHSRNGARPSSRKAAGRRLTWAPASSA